MGFYLVLNNRNIRNVSCIIFVNFYPGLAKLENGKKENNITENYYSWVSIEKMTKLHYMLKVIQKFPSDYFTSKSSAQHGRAPL